MVIYPVVAGTFYPEDSIVLQQNILKMIADAADKSNLQTPKAIIAPHAGYIYSGPIAASAYACLQKAKDQIFRVVIIALAHRYPVAGIATTAANFYMTPLGQIGIDQESIRNLNLSYVNVVEEAFAAEHSLEVQLPFLQVTIETFSLVPFLVGSASVQDVERLLEMLWGGPETLVVISSDLSHYRAYNAAQILDAKTAEAIVNLNAKGFSSDGACNVTAIKALLNVARRKQMCVTQVDLRNSGDTAGDKDKVVGYGAFHFV